MKIAILIFLTFFFFYSNSSAFDCDKAFFDRPVYHMCKQEELQIQQDTDIIKEKRDRFEKAIFTDAERQGKKQELEAALASTNKTPTEEFLINGFIRRQKDYLNEINYLEWKLTASKEEIEQIMDNYYEKANKK